MSNSDSNPPTDTDEEESPSGSPDITIDVTNGKHIKIDFDKGEWAVIGTFILLLTYMVGKFGWY
jgi:hypothetical protein